MTARQTTAGTAAAGYRADPPPIPQPRSNSDDPAEPGRRRGTDERRRQR